ncbi:MAG: hypothetical protein ABI876_15655, partial [Bacteroidota bacterium]
VYDSAAYPEIPNDGDVFERGVRGRWQSPIGYTYRSAVVGGSQHYSTQRNYKDAGVFNSFRIFDWQHPSFNDSTAWVKGDSVTKRSADGLPLETRDPLGIRSAMKLAYDDMLPVIVAANADYDGIAFTSFEDKDYQHNANTAHAGTYSLGIGTHEDLSAATTFTLTNQIKTKGVLLKFWVKTAATIADTGSPVLQAVFLQQGNSTVRINVRERHRIARTGEWTLYEIDTTALQAPVGTRVDLVFADKSGTDSVFVDDIKVQPSDAMAQCFVYDGRTFRDLAAFADNHFGAYTQYNAEGRAVRSIVETERGFRTVGDAYANQPRVDRTSLVEGEVALGGGAYSSAHRSQRQLDPDNGINGSQFKSNLLEMQIGPKDSKVKLLDGVKPSIPDSITLVSPDVNGATAPLIPLPPEALRGKLIHELRDLNAERNALELRLHDESNEKVRAVMEQQRVVLDARREAIIRQLGIPEEELKRLLNQEQKP